MMEGDRCPESQKSGPCQSLLCWVEAVVWVGGREQPGGLPHAFRACLHLPCLKCAE